MRLLAKRAVSWLMVALGALLGFLALASTGQDQFPDPSSDPYWLRPSVLIAGIGLLGLTFLTGSLVALRNRRRAGLVFLACTPVLAFCLAFPEAGFLVWHSDGGGYFHSPVLPTALGLGLLFYIPFLVPLFAIRNRRRAMYLFLISAAAVAPVFAVSQWTASLLPKLAGWSALFSVFGSFWLGTHKLGWPPLIAPMPKSLKGQVTTVLAGCLLAAALDVAATFAFIVWRSTSLSPDCGGRRVFARPVSPRHAVFAARLIRVGHSRRESGRWVGEWAIGRVEERFWGLPWSAPHFVLLTNSIFWEGETYFIDGERTHGLLTRFLPIVDAGPSGCNRTRPAVYATLELHVLREAPPVKGVRIIGYARKPEQDRSGWTPPMPYAPLVGARVSLTGPAGTTIVTTDQEGIYEVDGLPPDDYTIRLALPDTQIAAEGKVKKERMTPGSLIEQDFDVFWNGIIEGRLVDARGGPAHAWVLLQHSDGKDLGPHVRNFFESDKNGFFRIEKIPPGSYKFTINPYGPSDDWPYAPVYYPSERQSADAGVLEVAAGQHVKIGDFVLNPLPGRKLRARVTWPDGKAAEGAWVYVAYEHTLAYKSLRDAVDFRKADHGGVAELHVFGGSRIRVFAEDVVEDSKTVVGSPRYSAPVEFDTTKLPTDLNLVLSASTLPNSP
jgi:hypothetical protein